MSSILKTRFGTAKHVLMASVLILACMVNIGGDPITATGALAWWVSISISAALAAASIGMQMLFQPKAKPFDKNKLQGDIQITAIGEDIPISEIYGASLGDGIGGMRIGGTIFYASPIRKTVVTTPGQNTGGGKGAPAPPPTREHHYFIDLAVMGGRGPLRVTQIKAQSDLLYQAFTVNDQLTGTGYEAEDATAQSGGTEAADGDMSGGLKLNMPLNAYAEWNNVVASTDTAPIEIYIVYKSTADIDIEFTVNGGVYYAVLPDSFGIRQNVNLPKTLVVGSSNTIRIKNVTNATLGLDRIVVGASAIIPGGGGGGGSDGGGAGGGGGIGTELGYASGTRYEGWENREPSYDAMSLRDVYAADDRGLEQYNYQTNPNSLGELTANIVNNGTIRIYPGNTTQLPDPLLQEYFEALYGAGSTPAHRNRCFVVFENFEITKYGTVPNFTFVAEHETINSVGEMFAARALRAGLTEDEFDFSALDAVPLRGYAITTKQPPAREMELMSRIYDIDVYEDFDGKIVGVVPDETLAATIPLSELGSVEGGDVEGSDDKPFTPVVTTFRDETELPYFLDVSFFDASKDWETRNVHSLREVDSSDRKANIETGLVLTEAEAQKFADRDLHKQYVEKDGLQVNLFHKHTYLTPTNKIQVTDVDDSTPKMRIKAIEGWIPGSLDVRGVSRDADEYPPRLFVVANSAPTLPTVTPPAPIIGTFIDLAVFREEQTAGFYVAACLTDPRNVWAGAGLYREIAGDEWEALDGIPHQATMGRTVGHVDVGRLGDIPGGWVAGDWDTTNTLKLDLYYGELETLTDEQVLEGRNYLVVGNEIIQFATATRDNNYANRWVVSRLRRQLQNTLSAGHTASERVVLYTEAWRWIIQDTALAGTTRTYKFVGSGGDLETASSVDFNWTGRTQFNTPIYAGIDNNVPTVTAAPSVSQENGYWIISISRPSAFGYSANIAEIRLRKSTDDSLVRQIDIGNTVVHSVIAQAFDCKADYRWRNAYRLNGSDGWSAWSEYTAVVVGSIPPPPPIDTGGDGTPPEDVNPIGGGCFIAGVLVLMADWTQKTIETVVEGDYVMAWNHASRMMPALVKTAMQFDVKEYRKLNLTDDSLGVTETHPFLPDFNRKVSVADMKRRMQLREYAKGWQFTKVKSVNPVKGKTTVYNIEVETLHTYFVRGETGKAWKAVYNKIPIEN